MSTKICQDVSIGKNLRRLRRGVKLSQEKAAGMLQVRGIDISREIISQMERGLYSVRVSWLIALKDIYHVDSYDEFFKNL